MESSRNRWFYVAGAAVACAAVLVAANVAFAGGTAPAPISAGAPATTLPPTSEVTPSATRSSDVAAPVGRVIDTGLKAKTGSWVFYLVAIDEKQIPKTRFGLMLGRRLPSGTITADVETNETSGSDLTKGFHAGEGSMAVDGGTTPTFGYYVGPAAKITAKSHGKTITAAQAVSDKYPSVRVYWFAPGHSGITGLAAYDKAGKKLTAGNVSIGVG
jgi:hypothetical protein